MPILHRRYNPYIESYIRLGEGLTSESPPSKEKPSQNIIPVNEHPEEPSRSSYIPAAKTITLATPTVKTEKSDSDFPFEIMIGSRRKKCWVSSDALEGASGLPLGSTSSDHRRSFDVHRMLINKAASLKATLISGEHSEDIILNRNDLQRVPWEKGMLEYGRARGGRVRV